MLARWQGLWAGRAGGAPVGPPAFVGASSAYISGTAGPSHTFAFTAATSGANRKLFVATARQQNLGDITGITYNGQALSKAIDDVYTSPAPDVFVELWYLDGGSMPTDGSSHDVVVSCASMNLIAIAIEYVNIKQGAADSTGGRATTASGGGLHTANLTSVPADAIILGVGVNGAGASYAPIGGQDERCDAVGTSDTFTLFVSEKPGGAGGSIGISGNPSTGSSLLTSAAWGPPA